jgi:hypothetical protein
MIVVEVGQTVSFATVTVLFYMKSAVLRILFILVKLPIEFRNIELLCTQFNSRVYSLIHIILMFFLCGPATINFTFGFHAYFDYNRLPKRTRKTLFNIRALSLFRYSACFASLG